MKNLICYKSKNGATEKYCQMLAKEIDAEVLRFDQVSRKLNFANYDNIVISSGTYCGLMPLNRFLKRHWKKLDGNEVTVMAVGAAPADDDWSKVSYNRIPEKIRGKIQYFKLMGDDPKPAQGADYKTKVKKENLKPVVEYIKSK